MYCSFTNFLERNLELDLQSNLNTNSFQSCGREVISPWKWFLSVWLTLSDFVNLSWKWFLTKQGILCHFPSWCGNSIIDVCYKTQKGASLSGEKLSHIPFLISYVFFCFLDMAWKVTSCAFLQNSSQIVLLTRIGNSLFATSWAMIPFQFLNIHSETQVRCSNVLQSVPVALLIWLEFIVNTVAILITSRSRDIDF